MKKEMNKSAAEMAIGTIVIIIIAIILLVLLVFAASGAFGDFYNKYFVLGGGQVNVQTHVQACQTACATNSVYDYCNLQRNVVFNKDKNDLLNKQKYTCLELENPQFGTGLAGCSTITCPQQVPVDQANADTQIPATG